MPAESKAQRRFFGWAEHNPGQAKKEGVYPSGMTHQQMHDFAATPERGLPEKVSRIHIHGASMHDLVEMGNNDQVIIPPGCNDGDE